MSSTSTTANNLSHSRIVCITLCVFVCICVHATVTLTPWWSSYPVFSGCIHLSIFQITFSLQCSGAFPLMLWKPTCAAWLLIWTVYRQINCCHWELFTGKNFKRKVRLKKNPYLCISLGDLLHGLGTIYTALYDGKANHIYKSFRGRSLSSTEPRSYRNTRTELKEERFFVLLHWPACRIWRNYRHENVVTTNHNYIKKKKKAKRYRGKASEGLRGGKH